MLLNERVVDAKEARIALGARKECQLPSATARDDAPPILAPALADMAPRLPDLVFAGPVNECQPGEALRAPACPSHDHRRDIAEDSPPNEPPRMPLKPRL